MSIPTAEINYLAPVKPGDRVLLKHPNAFRHTDIVQAEAENTIWIIEVLDTDRVLWPTDAIASIGATLDTPRIGVVLGARAPEVGA